MRVHDAGKMFLNHRVFVQGEDAENENICFQCFQDMSMNFSCRLIQKGLGFLACDNARDKHMKDPVVNISIAFTIRDNAGDI